MIPHLTKAEAWREIARRIAEGEWAGIGLCWEAMSTNVNSQTSDEMLADIKRHIGSDAIYTAYGTDDETGPWAFPEGDASVRVLAALFLALEAEDEEANRCMECGAVG